MDWAYGFLIMIIIGIIMFIVGLYLILSKPKEDKILQLSAKEYREEKRKELNED